MYPQLFPENARQEIASSITEAKLYSQNGEDGVVASLFALIGTTNKFYVEFGTENGSERNTRVLQMHEGWQGLLMDGGYSNPSINLQKEFIMAENIEELFRKHSVPEEFDFLVVDIDYNDFYVWYCLKSFRPRVVCMEVNTFHSPSEDKVVKYDATAMWDGTKYFGSSLAATTKLANLKGYSLVYAESEGVNAFFVRNDCLASSGIKFPHVNDVNHHYHRLRFDKFHREDSLRRDFFNFQQAVKVAEGISAKSSASHRAASPSLSTSSAPIDVRPPSSSCDKSGTRPPVLSDEPAAVNVRVDKTMYYHVGERTPEGAFISGPSHRGSSGGGGLKASISKAGSSNATPVAAGQAAASYDQHFLFQVPMWHEARDVLRKGYLPDKYILTAIWRFLERGGLALEVGAGVGCCAVPMAAALFRSDGIGEARAGNGKMLVWEANASVLALLQNNARVNGLEKVIVACSPSAAFKGTEQAVDIDAWVLREEQGRRLQVVKITASSKDEVTAILTTGLEAIKRHRPVLILGLSTSSGTPANPPGRWGAAAVALPVSDRMRQTLGTGIGYTAAVGIPKNSHCLLLPASEGAEDKQSQASSATTESRVSSWLRTHVGRCLGEEQGVRTYLYKLPNWRKPPPAVSSSNRRVGNDGKARSDHSDRRHTSSIGQRPVSGRQNEDRKARGRRRETGRSRSRSRSRSRHRKRERRSRSRSRDRKRDRKGNRKLAVRKASTTVRPGGVRRTSNTETQSQGVAPLAKAGIL